MEILKKHWVGLAFIGSFVLALVFFIEADLIDKWYVFTRQHEDWELDELPLVFAFMGFWALLFAFVFARREARLNVIARARAEALTSRSLRQFLEAMEGCTIGIVFFDSEDRLVLVNEALRQLEADGGQFALGRTLADLKEMAVDAKFGSVVDTALFREIVSRETGPSGMTEAAFKGRDYRIGKSTTADGGFLVVVEDVTDRKKAEELLRDRVRFQRTLFNAMPIPIYAKDENGHYTGCNPAFEEYFGIYEENLIGKSVFDVVPPERATLYNDSDKALMAAGGHQIYDTQYPAKDGELRDVKFSKAVFTKADGSIGGIVGAIVDLTEIKRTEEALRQSEARLRAVLGNSPASIYLKDTEGRFLLVNREFERRNGLKSEQILNKTSHDLIPEKSARIVMAEDRQVLESGQPCTFQRELTYQSGYTGTFLATKFPVTNEQGKLIGVGSVSTDVSERTKAIHAVRETAGQLHSIIEHSPAAIHLRDKNGRSLHANKVYLSRFGYSDIKDVVGKTAHEYLPKDIADKVVIQDREVIECGETRTYDMVMEVAGGTSRNIHLTRFPVFDLDGGLMGTGAIATDITESKRAEVAAKHLQAQLAQASRMGIMGEMAAGFAHELNQPLAAIKNYVTGVMRRVRSGDSNAQAYVPILELVIDQAQRASEIIRRIRRFVRKGDIELAPTNVNNSVAAAVDMLAVELDQEVSLKKELARNLPPVRADSVQIQQVVLNLLRNAIEAVENVEGQKEIVARVRSEGRFLVRISVEDTGSGIPESVRKRLFEPFFTTKPSGMGMGLLICRTILEEHGSRLDISSAPHGGTTVSFCLPVAEEAATEGD